MPCAPYTPPSAWTSRQRHKPRVRRQRQYICRPRLPAWNADFFLDGISHPTARLPRQGDHDDTPLPVWGVRVYEVPRPDASTEKEPMLEWMLLTNRPVFTVDAARVVAEDYACRWTI